jgi:hypothetical protein
MPQLTSHGLDFEENDYTTVKVYSVRFQVLTVMSMQMAVFWDVVWWILNDGSNKLF